MRSTHGRDGYQHSVLAPIGTPTNGLLLGWSDRYVDAADAGRTAWAWSVDRGLERLGFFDGEHTSASGSRSSSVQWSSLSQMAFGTSTRYSRGAEMGQTAWVWTRSAGVRRVGLADAAHTRTDGYRESNVRVYAGGVLGGDSMRYDGMQEAGRTAWIESPEFGFVRVGLTDTEHTGVNGEQSSGVTRVYPGFAIGSSTRYPNGYPAGQSGWVWTPAAGTVRIGLIDGPHVSTSGRSSSTIPRATNDGLIVGYSMRYDDETPLGESLWAYDLSTGVLHPIRFPGDRGDGTERTLGMTPQGVVYGSFMSYGDDGATGPHAFAWSAGRGITDLGALAEGWEGLGLGSAASVDEMLGVDDWDGTGPAVIVGRANLAGGPGAGVFVLTAPACPADFDGDGAASMADYAAFLEAFAADGPRADWNGDGFVDCFDVAGFLDTLDGGC